MIPPELRGMIAPHLSDKAAKILKETAEAERACNGEDGALVADAIEFLLDKERRIKEYLNVKA